MIVAIIATAWITSTALEVGDVGQGSVKITSPLDFLKRFFMMILINIKIKFIARRYDLVFRFIQIRDKRFSCFLDFSLI